MWKWFKRLLILVIVLFLAVVALLIPDKIDSQDQLKNVSPQTSLVDLARLVSVGHPYHQVAFQPRLILIVISFAKS